MPPQASTDPATLMLLLSKILPSSKVRPLATSSSPVARMDTTGRRMTLAEVNPSEAMTPISAGRTGVPASSTCCPRRTSSAAGRTFTPTGKLEYIATWSSGLPAWRRSTSSVSSKGTTASAPAGMGAPVMMRIATPETTVWLETWPAATMPITSRLRGDSGEAPCMSALSTA